jgi:hypothetical protein
MTNDWDTASIIAIVLLVLMLLISEVLGEIPERYVQAGSVLGVIYRTLKKLRTLVGFARVGSTPAHIINDLESQLEPPPLAKI